MEITINKVRNVINENDYLAEGGEGSIYKLSKDCLKLLNDESLRKKNKIDKVFALCDKSEYLMSLEGFEQIGIPLFPAYKANQFCGFSMAFFNGCIAFSEVYYDLFDQKFTIPIINDINSINIIQQLFYTLQLLHNQKIILGDLNSDNILFNEAENKTYIVDIDSAQVGNFYCEVTKKEYCCPEVERLGINNSGAYSYSTASDIFSLSIICFEFLIGPNPYGISVNPMIDILEAKQKGINYLSYHFTKKRNIKGFELADESTCELIFKRLDQIKKLHPTIYNHFVSIFYFNKRDYFKRKKINIQQKKRKTRYIKPIRGYTPSKLRQDPKEFQMYLQMYNLKLPQ